MLPQFRLFDAEFKEPRYAGRQIIEILLNSTQRSFGGPSGGKSDAADPFLIVPRSNFNIFYIFSKFHEITSRLVHSMRNDVTSVAVAATEPEMLQNRMF